MLAQTDIFPISQLNSWAQEWRRRIRMFSIEWTHTQNQFTLTHERAYKQLILMRNFGCLLSIHHSLYHFNYVQGSFIHFKSFVFLSRARVCVWMFVLFVRMMLFSSLSLLIFGKRKSHLECWPSVENGYIAWCSCSCSCSMLLFMCMFAVDVFFPSAFFIHIKMSVYSFCSRRFHHFSPFLVLSRK